MRIKTFLTEAVIQRMSAAGGLLILAPGLNLLEIERSKVANRPPAVFMPPFFSLLIRGWTAPAG